MVYQCQNVRLIPRVDRPLRRGIASEIGATYNSSTLHFVSSRRLSDLHSYLQTAGSTLLLFVQAGICSSSLVDRQRSGG